MSTLTRAAGAQVRERSVELAEALVEDQFIRRPELAQRYGASPFHLSAVRELIAAVRAA